MPEEMAAGGEMPQTRWSVVLAAGHGAREALETLCRAYWYPLYVYLRRWGKGPHDAEDLIQGFFAHLLDPTHQRLATVQRDKGRFRSFLLVCLKRYAKDAQPTRPMGTARNPLPLETGDAENRYLHEPVDPQATPDTLFEQAWAGSLLERAMAELGLEFQQAGKSARFETLRIFLPGRHPELSHAEAAAALGTTEQAINAEVSRMRKRLGELIRREIAHVVVNPLEIEDELAYLARLWSR